MIYVGHSDDLSAERFPFRHPRAACWVKRAGSKWKLLHLHVRGARAACASHREQIAQELCAVYRPGCNEQQYDRAWKDEWIGEYTAPTTGPLTTGRQPPTRSRPALTPSRARGSAGRTGPRRGGSRRRRCSRERRRAGRRPRRRPYGAARARAASRRRRSLGHAVEQRQRAGHDAAGAVDVLARLA